MRARMGRGRKVGRNDPCPCRSGRKYKHCCEGRVDWPTLLGKGTVGEVLPNLSVRGKNLFFLEELGGALQLDKLDPTSMPDFKRAFTPEATEKIYTATTALWHDMDDLARGLASEASKTSALFTGIYDVGRIVRGVTRHSLYADRILLVDPFIDARRVRAEYNPLLHPEEHAQTALRWTWLWLSMAPWIEADLVHFVRTPGDFDTELFLAASEVSLKRYASHPKLDEAAKAMIADEAWLVEDFSREILLRSPDWYLRNLIAQALPDSSEEDVQAIIAEFHKQRDEHPFVLEPPQEGSFGDITQMSTGTSYEMAKWTASISESHLVTDLRRRVSAMRPQTFAVTALMRTA